MSSEAMKAIFNNLTSGASRRAELEYSVDSATHCEADSIKVSVKSARLSTQMHVMDMAEAQLEDPRIEAAMDWYHLNKKKLEPIKRAAGQAQVQARDQEEYSRGKKHTVEC